MQLNSATHLDSLLERLRQVCTSESASRREIIGALEDLLMWLDQPDNNTDANCRKVDYFVTLHINSVKRRELPKDIEEILFDVGGALHDTHTSPEVAENFESTPRQLLARVRKLRRNGEG